MTIENHLTQENMLQDLKSRGVDLAALGGEHISLFRYASLVGSHPHIEEERTEFDVFSHLKYLQ